MARDRERDVDESMSMQGFASSRVVALERRYTTGLLDCFAGKTHQAAAPSNVFFFETAQKTCGEWV